MENLSISQAEDEDLILEEDEFLIGETDCDLCLVGRFLTEQLFNFNIMKTRMAAIWKPNKGVLFKNIGNDRFLIQFFHKLDIAKVLDGGPWSFDNHPMIVHKLRLGDVPHRVPLNTLPFWVQIYNIPHGLFTERVGKSLGNFIGTFLAYDDSNLGAAWLPYMRIKVEINVNQPLRRWKKIKVKDGNSIKVDFKYERLQIFCFICGKLGHSERFCDVPYSNPDSVIDKGWGAFLKAPNRRNQPVLGGKWLRSEARDGSGVSPSEPSHKVEAEYLGSGLGVHGNGGYVVPFDVQGREIAMEQDRIGGFNNDLSSLINNPCFEEDFVSDVNLDPRKRKRLSLVLDDSLESKPCSDASDDLETIHFLSAGPGPWDCRKL